MIRRIPTTAIWISVVAFLSLVSPIAGAADLLDSMEKALMPGPLHKVHAKFEEKCTECHAFFQQSRQNDLCLKCHDHKNILDDINKKRGFHGRTPEIRVKDCKDCHREHIGREADIIFLDKQTFDHNTTDFTLRGAHIEVQCKACHKADKEYREAKRVCYECHKDAEPHKGTLGKVCDSCHRETAWNDFQFDHSRTDFKLVGKHKGVECRDCHPQERYLSIPTECYSCHKLDDKHKGRFGKKCKECHAPTGWAKQAFDHDLDTDFKLTGKHTDVSCEQCHKKNAFDQDIATDCYGCHKLTDEHKGKFGKKCQDCHTTKSWGKPKFDHDKKTDFPLRGKHKDAICTDCHPGDLFKDEVSTACYDCHKQHDVHNGQQGKHCDECHQEKGWSKNVAFDHDITRFPLLGSHASLACEECHSSTNFKDAKVKCGICHVDDDIHKRRLGKECSRCHISSDFKAWQFDHDKDTDFKLKGSHKEIDCHACHREPVEDEIELPQKCFGCHAADDAHDGGFGRVCERCHNEKSFDEVNIQ